MVGLFYKPNLFFHFTTSGGKVWISSWENNDPHGLRSYCILDLDHILFYDRIPNRLHSLQGTILIRLENVGGYE